LNAVRAVVFETGSGKALGGIWGNNLKNKIKRKAQLGRLGNLATLENCMPLEGDSLKSKTEKKRGSRAR